jgi:hypothetical protein
MVKVLLRVILIQKVHILKEENRSKAISTTDKNSDFSSFSNTLTAHLDRFVNYLQYTKNASTKTIENYTLWINRFIDHIGDVDASTIRMIDIQDFRTYLRSQ